jgi:CoA:oxalate CoA-transferase
VPGPLGTRHPSIAPFQALRASDGYLVLAAGNDALFAKLCEALGRAALAQDPRFASNASRTQNVDALTDELERALAGAGTAHWLERLEAAGVPCGPLNDVAAVLDDPQVRARNMVVTSEDPAAGTLTLAGNPVKLSGVEDPATRPAAPALDADREALLDEFGLA